MVPCAVGAVFRLYCNDFHHSKGRLVCGRFSYRIPTKSSPTSYETCMIPPKCHSTYFNVALLANHKQFLISGRLDPIAWNGPSSAAISTPELLIELAAKVLSADRGIFLAQALVCTSKAKSLNCTYWIPLLPTIGVSDDARRKRTRIIAPIRHSSASDSSVALWHSLCCRTGRPCR